MILVNLSNLPFSTMNKRNQSIFTHLVEGDYFFTSGIFVDLPLNLPRHASLIDRLRSWRRSRKFNQFSANLSVISPTFYLPFSFRAPVKNIQSSNVVENIRRLIGKEQYCLWINSPEANFSEIARELIQGATRIVVDLSDDFTAFKNSTDDDISGRLRYYVEQAHVLIAINEHVARKFPHPDTYIFPNSTDHLNFLRNDPSYRHPPVLPKPADARYIGFIGGFNRGRIDEPLVLRLIRELPDLTFIFAGSTNDRQLREKVSNAGANAVFIESVPYEILPYIIKSFDVAIVPHLINEHTRGNDLLKVLDYMACGVPVVTTNCSNVCRFSDALYIAETHDEFESLVRSLIDLKLQHDPGKGLDYAGKFSWSATVPDLAKFLHGIFNVSETV